MIHIYDTTLQMLQWIRLNLLESAGHSTTNNSNVQIVESFLGMIGQIKIFFLEVSNPKTRLGRVYIGLRA